MLSLLENTPVKSLVAPHVKHALRMFSPSSRVSAIYVLQELLGRNYILGGRVFLSSLIFKSENELLFYNLNLKKIQWRAVQTVQGLCSIELPPF